MDEPGEVTQPMPAEPAAPARPTGPGPDWRGFLARLARLLLVALVAFLVLAGVAATLAGVVARQWWVADLATHFKAQLALGLAACALALALLRSYGLAVLALLAAAVNMAFVVLLYLPAADPGYLDALPVRVMLANVHRASADYPAVVSLVHKEEPDAVVFIEVSPEWVAGLAPLEAAYPHRVVVARSDDYGLAVYSRLPLGQTVTPTLGTLATPAIATTAQVRDKAVTLIAAHPPPPKSTELAAERNRQYEELATLVRMHDAPMVLCADLNSTPWSPFFTDLLSGTGLRNSRQGFGVLATWNADWPRMAAIPIDHCLVSPDVAVRSLRYGPRVGSDHLPLIVDVAINRR